MTIKLPNVPTREDLQLIVKWAEDLSKNIEDYINKGQDGIRLKKLFNEPPKPRDGDVVFVGTVAEGSNWDPDSSGDGGFFGYYGADWHKLG
jgi:hypothetical protein